MFSDCCSLIGSRDITWFGKTGTAVITRFGKIIGICRSILWLIAHFEKKVCMHNIRATCKL